MEIEAVEHFATIGWADGAAKVARGGRGGILARRLKPLGRLFARKPKKGEASMKSDKSNHRKAERRPSGSTVDVPTLHYDSCDDPSQDHRTEPTTSVDSVLHSLRGEHRRPHRPLKLRRGGAGSAGRGQAQRGGGVNNEEPAASSGAGRVASCLVGTSGSSQKETSDGSAEEGVELVLDERSDARYDDADEFCGDVFLSFQEGLGHGTNRQTVPSPRGTSLHDASLFTHTYHFETANKDALPATGNSKVLGVTGQPNMPSAAYQFGPIIEGNGRLPSEESKQWKDDRPLKEVVFTASEDHFDDLDELTLPPIGYPTLVPQYPNRPLYSHALYNPPSGKPFGALASRSSRSKTAATPCAGEPDIGPEELFATFVKERHGPAGGSALAAEAAVSDSLSPAGQSPTDPLVMATTSTERTSTGFIERVTSFSDFDDDSEEDKEVMKIIMQGQEKVSERKKGVVAHSQMVISENSSSLTSQEGNEQQKAKKLIKPDHDERLSKPHAKQIFGRIQRRPTPDVSTPTNFLKGNASPATEDSARLPSLSLRNQVPTGSPVLDAWNVDASVSSRSSEHYSASRESVGDTLTRDSLMEMLDAAAARQQEARTWVLSSRPEDTALPHYGRELMIRRSTTEESSLSDYTSLHRATPVLGMYQCPTIDVYPRNGVDGEDFGLKLRDENLMSDLKTDLLNKVDEFKRESSLVVSNLIRQISSRNNDV